ncbi:MAG TPA: hypothetical protein VG722_00960 [Tepidisphaeraceae bacterium]|nr:hypothetical protein [Tepidisphaeraceae bacterium]
MIVRKQGYVTAKTTTQVNPPWWQWIPLDFFAELMPVRLVDRQVFTYTLLPASDKPANAQWMLENANEYRAELRGKGTATTQP